jgi:hypothetical protein
MRRHAAMENFEGHKQSLRIDLFAQPDKSTLRVMMASLKLPKKPTAQCSHHPHHHPTDW